MRSGCSESVAYRSTSARLPDLPYQMEMRRAPRRRGAGPVLGLSGEWRAAMYLAMSGFLGRRVVDPLKAQLTQGVSPTKLALALTLGAVVGVLPVLGTTTLLCAVAAAALRLNQPAIQVANYVAYPLQLLLFIPFFQAGARLFGQPPVPFTLGQIRAELAADALGTVGRYLGANLRAVAAWGLLAPLAAAVLFLALRALLSRLPLPAGEPSRP